VLDVLHLFEKESLPEFLNVNSEVSTAKTLEKSKYEQALDLWEKYSDPDSVIISDKGVWEIEILKNALTEEHENAASEISSVHQALAKLSSEGKIKGTFIKGNENEYDSYSLDNQDETPITLVLVPGADQYEWSMAEGLQFGVSQLPNFDVLYKDLAYIRKSALLDRLFSAVRADNTNPDLIAKLKELLVINEEKKRKALIAEWRPTLEYVLTDLKDEKSGKSVLIDQPFPYSRNGKTKSFKILKADRTGLLVMIDEELELDRKFPLEQYAGDMVQAFLPLLQKHKGKTASVKAGSKGAKAKTAEAPLPVSPEAEASEASPEMTEVPQAS
jgi:hypothetical protein